jgi:hypothetical protein
MIRLRTNTQEPTPRSKADRNHAQPHSVLILLENVHIGCTPTSTSVCLAVSTRTLRILCGEYHQRHPPAHTQMCPTDGETSPGSLPPAAYPATDSHHPRHDSRHPRPDSRDTSRTNGGAYPCSATDSRHPRHDSRHPRPDSRDTSRTNGGAYPCSATDSRYPVHPGHPGPACRSPCGRTSHDTRSGVQSVPTTWQPPATHQLRCLPTVRLRNWNPHPTLPHCEMNNQTMDDNERRLYYV